MMRLDGAEKTMTTRANLALYHYQSCPYCHMTRAVIDSLSLQVSHRDIQLQSQHRRDLIGGGGRAQVPCLRIEEEGQVLWLYESGDIIDYLKRSALQAA